MGRHRQQAVPARQWQVRGGAAAVVLGLGAIAVTMFGGAAAAAVSDASGAVPTCVTTTAPATTDTTGPETTQPETTDTTQPDTTQPETTDTTQPDTTQPDTTQPETTDTTRPETTDTTVTSAPETTDTTETLGTGGPTLVTDLPLLAVGKRVDASGLTTVTLTSLPSAVTCDSSAAGSVIVTEPAGGSSAIGASATGRVGDPVLATSAGVAAESDSRSAAAADTNDLATTGGPGTYVLLAGLCLLAAGVLMLISTAPNRLGKRSH